MSSSTAIYTALTGIALYFVSRWWRSRIPRGLKRPPGPPGHYLIGNLLDVPKTKQWLTFNQWANEYGTRFAGLSLKPPDSLKSDWAITVAQYGETWRCNRTYFHQIFGQAAVENYHEIQTKYTNHLEIIRDIFGMFGALILETTYGIRAASEKDPFLILSETTIQRIIEAGIPGTYLVDIFPVCTQLLCHGREILLTGNQLVKYVPSWFPGAKFQREMGQLRRQVEEMLNRSIVAKSRVENGDARPSAVSVLIEEFGNDINRPDDHEDIIKHVTGVEYMTAIDTSTGVLLNFIYAMLLHPEVQRRAQNELDEVVGSGTLPSFEDFGRLKYTRAVFQELLRWNAVTPSGLPHALKVDDVVNGYFIPKGTIVFGNTWSLLRIKSVYGPDADKFNPERFLDERMPFPDFAFGYGRRSADAIKSLEELDC
ncbi:hypothetical protein Clacol_005270 [Clathrus columnatus]|uniref:Cytochrome P450 n=1 Tax=Clathrus columnatus TaxID=1419009 RepID=A0AAV5A8U5_9AGAM|nr:hypothetical protein Clacol_005270 [Clathrus columnatus]